MFFKYGLNQRVREISTGITGVVWARTQYLNDIDHYAILVDGKEGQEEPEGKVLWLNENQIEPSEVVN